MKDSQHFSGSVGYSCVESALYPEGQTYLCTVDTALAQRAGRQKAASYSMTEGRSVIVCLNMLTQNYPMGCID